LIEAQFSEQHGIFNTVFALAMLRAL